MCTPEHPQANGTAEKMMSNLVKATHVAIAEKGDPKAAVHKYQAFMRATPHASTGKAPSELLMGRRLKLKIPGLLGKFDSELHKEARKADLKKKEEWKAYADAHRGAKEREPEVGERVLIRQKKSTIRPPWNPDPYTITKVKGSQITAHGGGGGSSQGRGTRVQL